MADNASKYSIRLAAQDAFSKTFGEFSEAAQGVKNAVSDQQKALRDLNRQAKELDGFRRLGRDLEETTGKLTEARTEQQRLTREQQEARSTVERLAGQVAKSEAAVKALSRAEGASVSEIAKAEKAHASLTRKLAAAENASRKLDAQQDKATAGVKTLEAAARGQRTEMGRLEQSLSEAGIDTGKLASEQERLESSVKQANAALMTQRGRLDAVSSAQGRIEANRAARADLHGQMLATGAAIYAGAKPIKQAMELETAGREYAKVSNASDADVAALTSYNLKQAATNRAFAAGDLSAVDLFRIEAAAGQGGIDPSEIKQFTTDAATMATAFDMSADDAGATMMKWRSALGLDQARTVRLGDTANALGNNLAADSGDISRVLARQGAIAMTSGFTEQQAAAISAVMLQSSSEEVSATGLKNLSNALSQGDKLSKPRQAALAEIGFDASALPQMMQDDAQGTLLEVLDALKATDPAKVTGLAGEIFGQEALGAIMPLVTNTKDLEKALRISAADNTGSMQKEAEGLAGSSQTTWNRTVASVVRLSTIVGTSLLPAFEAVANPAADFLNLISDFAEQFPTVTAGVSLAVAGLVAAKTAVLGLKFGGLLLGQVRNRKNLAEAKLDVRLANTTNAANGAIGRLNATLNRTGRGGAGAYDAEGRGRARGRASRIRPRGRFGRLASMFSRSTAAAPTFAPAVGGMPRAPFMPGMGAPVPPASAAGAARASAAGLGGAAGAAGAAGSARATATGLGGAAGAAGAPGAAGAAGSAAKPGMLSRLGTGLGNSKALRFAGRAAMPLTLALGAADAAAAVSEGDAEGTGSALGGMGGALGGGAMGAAIGTAILPGIGSVVGGILGSLAGSSAGQWAGGKLGQAWNWAFGDDDEPQAALAPQALQAAGQVAAGPQIAPQALQSAQQVATVVPASKPAQIDPAALQVARTLGDPAETAQQVTNNTDSRTISPQFDIKIESSGDPARDEALLDRLMARLRAEIMPMLSDTGGLDMRLDSALTDKGA